MAPRPKSVTVHLIANAHLDPVWLWRWTEGCEALVATVRSALDRLAETPDLIFTASSAALYAWIETARPALFREIAERVRQGRWHIVGGWWVEPDCNVPSGESLVRQALYGQRYFQEKFGVTARVGYHVDGFGHPATLPQLLTGAGLAEYVFFRPGPHEKTLPEALFWWESPDGARVLACRPPGHYGQGSDTPEELIRRIHEHAAERVNGLDDALSFVGIGNHGGGPTQLQIRAVQQVAADSAGPHAVFSALDTFFDAARARRDDYPVVRDELQHHARGCYSAHSAVKRWNREAEALLGTAEAFAALATATGGQTYPHDALGTAWRNVLFNQFHDILAGTSLPEAYDDALDLYGEARSLASRALWQALQALARETDTRGEGQAWIANNPLPWPARAVLSAGFDAHDPEVPDRIVRADGVALPTQRVQSTALTDRRSDRLIWVDELPPLGHVVYHQQGSLRAPAVEPGGLVAAGLHFIENAHLRLELDPATGCVARLFDKTHNVDAFSGPAAPALVLADASDTWSHDVSQFRELVGRFGAAEVSIEETGPLRAAIRATSTFGASTLVQTFRLVEGAAHVEVEAEVDWRESFRMLKLAFPVAVDGATVTSSVPYGHVTRPATGEEEPCGPWVDVTGEGERGDTYGVTVITDSKHGYDALERELRISVLRSPIYAWHDPERPNPDRRYRFMDQGVQHWRYWILPHAGPWQESAAIRCGLAINRPPVLVGEYAHAGRRAARQPGIEVAPANVVLSALKCAEDGNGFIMRLWETAGRAAEARVSFSEIGACWQGAIGAGKILTLRLRRQATGWDWRLVDMLERDGNGPSHGA